MPPCAIPAQLWNRSGTWYSAVEPSGPGSNFSCRPSGLSGPQPKQWPSKWTSISGSAPAVPLAGEVLGAVRTGRGVGQKRVDRARLLGAVDGERHLVRGRLRDGIRVLVEPRLLVVGRLQGYLHVLRRVGPRAPKVLDDDVQLPLVAARVDARVEAVRPGVAVARLGARAEGLLCALVRHDVRDLAGQVTCQNEVLRPRALREDRRRRSTHLDT